MKRIRLLLLAAMLTVLNAAAIDFRMTAADGAVVRPADYDSPYLLLFLYNSGCDNCSRSVQRIVESELLEKACRNGALRIVSVAVFEEDNRHWKRKAAEFPEGWDNFCDADNDIVTSPVLDFSTVPAFILLDAKRDVAFSDISMNALLRHLESDSTFQALLSPADGTPQP